MYDFAIKADVECEVIKNVSVKYNCSNNECHNEIEVYFASVILKNKSVHNLCADYQECVCCTDQSCVQIPVKAPLDNCYPFLKYENFATIHSCFVDMRGKVFFV